VTELHPVDILEEEHEVILALLRALENKVDALRSGAELDRRFWMDATAFLSEFADACHHAKEEDLLFVKLVELGLPEHGGPIGVMKQEHHLARTLTARIRDAAMASDPHAIVEHASSYIQLLRDHIDKENHVLFEMARELIREQDSAQLLQEFEDVDTRKSGSDVYHKHVRTAIQLCREAFVTPPSEPHYPPAAS